MKRRCRILEVARRRFEHYGYEKTTMAEIAADAEVAVGTLYLYFRSKEELLEAFGRECQERYVAAQQKIARSPLTPSERLRQLVHLRVMALKEQMEATPHGGEVLLRMIEKRHTCCQEREERELGMIEQILREGVEAGEFAVQEPAQAARAFRSAFAGFMPPASLRRPAEELRREVDAVYDLLLCGLSGARAQAVPLPQPARQASAPVAAAPAMQAPMSATAELQK